MDHPPDREESEMFELVEGSAAERSARVFRAHRVAAAEALAKQEGSFLESPQLRCSFG